MASRRKIRSLGMLAALLTALSASGATEPTAAVPAATEAAAPDVPAPDVPAPEVAAPGATATEAAPPAAATADAPAGAKKQPEPVPPTDYLLPVPPPEELLKGPAFALSNLSPGVCRSRLAKSPYAKSFKRLGSQSGIATPLRIVEPLDGIKFLVPGPKFPFGTLDCRQALLWIELLPVLHRHQVVEVRIDNFYRQGARLPGRRAKKSQHAYGLAADVVSVRFDPDGDGPLASFLVDVEEDFAGLRGEAPCGPEAKLHLEKEGDAAPTKGSSKKNSSAAKAEKPEEPGAPLERAQALRNLVCEVARGGYFHHILTPNYNAAHENHLHLDIKRDGKWFSLN